MFELTKNYSISPLGDSYDVVTYGNYNFVCNRGFISRGTTLLFISEGLVVGKNKLLELLTGEDYQYSLKGRKVVRREIFAGIVSNSIVVKWSHLRYHFFRKENLQTIDKLSIFWEMNKMFDWSSYLPITGFQELIAKKYTTSKQKAFVPRPNYNVDGKFTVQFHSESSKVDCFIGKRKYRGFALKKKKSFLCKILNLFRIVDKPCNTYYPKLSEEGEKAVEAIGIFQDTLFRDPLAFAYNITVPVTFHNNEVYIGAINPSPRLYHKRTILNILDNLLLNEKN